MAHLFNHIGALLLPNPTLVGDGKFGNPLSLEKKDIVNMRNTNGNHSLWQVVCYLLT